VAAPTLKQQQRMRWTPCAVLPADAIAETMRLAAKLKQSRSGQAAAAGGTGHNVKGQQEAALPAAQEKAAQKARRKAAAAAAAAARRGVGAVLKAKGRKGKAGAAGSLQQQQGLARLLMSKSEIERQKRQGGMVVVRAGAGAFGRDTAGTSALDVLNMSSSSSR